ncbi:MAG: hypothetical protein M0Z99_09570 [Betaproteobacteria bacterium]|nr:hypothetical protein [Betaproteobacteria bacterium]
MVFVLAALSACTPGKSHVPGMIGAQDDIRERLSDVIISNGFSHGLRHHRDGLGHYDELNISISLDSLKGRHLSLEKLMMDIGSICAHPSYAHLPIRIFIGAGDEDDQMYLYAILATAVRGSPNVALLTANDSRNDSRNQLIVTVLHRDQGE